MKVFIHNKLPRSHPLEMRIYIYIYVSIYSKSGSRDSELIDQKQNSR